jgi:hypothetical protein
MCRHSGPRFARSDRVGGWSAIGFAAQSAAGIGQWSATKMVVQEFAESFRKIVELRFASGDDMTLIRPDGYVAYAAHDGKGTLASVRSLLACQTNSAMAL